MIVRRVVLGVFTLALAAALATGAERPERDSYLPEPLQSRVRELRAAGVERPMQVALSELHALRSETVGAQPPQRTVTPPADYSLVLEGSASLGGYVFKEGQAFLHNDGGAAAGNTALGLSALITGNSYSIYNTAVGQNALQLNTYGSNNTAVGYSALSSNTIADQNTAVGSRALESVTFGYYNTAVGAFALQSNGTGFHNVAVGRRALGFLDSGMYNVAVGSEALRSTEGIGNVAVGHEALKTVQFGSNNVAIGILALENTTTSGSVAVGGAALRFNSAGYGNTAVGDGAMVSLEGSYNTAIGFGAGENLYYGDHNILIGSQGSYSEDNTIRIGDENQNRTFIAGIRGATVMGDALGVRIDSNGQLGTASSSRRFKREIHEVGDASSRIFDLRPVSFKYRKRPGEASPEYGLIAEEVAETFPELLIRDEEGRPETVKYHLLPPLLLNELKRQERELRFHRWMLLILVTSTIGLIWAGPRLYR